MPEVANVTVYHTGAENDSASLTVVQCEDKKNSSHFEHSPHTAAADREH